MRSARRIALILFAAATLALQVSAQRMPTRSFLNKPAHSVAQLIQQVRTDPVVLKRYMLHYDMSMDELIEFFRTLRVGKLDKTGYYKIYHVDKNFTIGHRMLRVKAGELVFVDD